MKKNTKTEKPETKAFEKGFQFGGEFLSGITSHATAVFKLVKTSNSLEAFDGTMSEFQSGMRKALKDSGYSMPAKYRQWKSNTIRLCEDFYQGNIKEVLKLGTFSKIDVKMRELKKLEKEENKETQSASEASDNSQAENPEVPTLTLTGMQATMLNKIDSELILEADKKKVWTNIFKVIETALKDQEKLNTKSFPKTRLKTNVNKVTLPEMDIAQAS
jgi:delta 1-pyrroline-5-carboxylate dehydrogenase